jgi:hypothetical protein
MNTRLYTLTIALILLFTAGAFAAEDYCFECHAVQEGMSLIYKDDVHRTTAKFGCEDCHGGDPKINDMNASKLPKTGFRPRPTRQSIPDYCGRCHSDAKYMAKANPKVAVSSLALYARSVHGHALAAGKKGSAECGDCHGVHDTRAVKDPESKVNPKKIADTCGSCHAASAEAFKDSPHGTEFTSDRRPGCVACHASHDTQPATTALFTDKDTGCVKCHRANSEANKVGVEIAAFLTKLEEAGPASAEALKRARQASHSVDIDVVKKAAASATQPAPQ